MYNYPTHVLVHTVTHRVTHTVTHTHTYIHTYIHTYTVGMMKHLEEAEEKHSLLKLVKQHEEESISRLGKEFFNKEKRISEQQ